jgi:hypothetical protein
MRVATQEITGTLSVEDPSEILTLDRLRADDVLYAFAESTSGDLAPALILRNYGHKPLRSDNLSRQEPVAKLSYRVLHDANNYKLEIIAPPSGAITDTADYRPNGLPVVKEPTEVQIGVTLEQITNIDQVSEKFGAVATLEMVWQDPALAFSPDTCECDYRTFGGEAFYSFVAENEIP